MIDFSQKNQRPIPIFYSRSPFFCVYGKFFLTLQQNYVTYKTIIMKKICLSLVIAFLFCMGIYAEGYFPNNSVFPVLNTVSDNPEFTVCGINTTYEHDGKRVYTSDVVGFRRPWFNPADQAALRYAWPYGQASVKLLWMVPPSTMAAMPPPMRVPARLALSIP